MLHFLFNCKNRNKNRSCDKDSSYENGFTIIEALVVLFIFALITVSFYSVFSVGLKYIIDSKNRLGAIAVANEKMETIRNLAYDDVGIQDGAPSGNILQDEDVTENTKGYHIHTDIIYRDDSLDGVYPTDTVPNDYKRVTVTVSWYGFSNEAEKVELTSRFVSPSLEVANSGDGILSINVFSDQPGGTGIPSSEVHITNSDIGLDVTTDTDNGGNVILVGSNIKDSIQKYVITLTKDGYEAVSTMSPYPVTSYSPIDVHASVVTGSLNVANIVQNKLANLKVSSVNYLGESIENIDFGISGGRKLGYEVVDGIVTSTPVYNLVSDTKTESDGEKDFGAVSPGEYTISLPSSTTDLYEVIGAYPINSFKVPFDNNVDFEIKLASKNVTSLLIKVMGDDESNTPVAGAKVQVTNISGYDVTLTTGSDGVVFFPVTSDIFVAGNYNIKITADGFEDNTSEITVSDGELKKEDKILTTSL